jgi:hypothetical protein
VRPEWSGPPVTEELRGYAIAHPPAPHIWTNRINDAGAVRERHATIKSALTCGIKDQQVSIIEAYCLYADADFAGARLRGF